MTIAIKDGLKPAGVSRDGAGKVETVLTNGQGTATIRAELRAAGETFRDLEDQQTRQARQIAALTYTGRELGLTMEQIAGELGFTRGGLYDLLKSRRVTKD